MYEFEEMGIRATSAEPIYPSEAVQIDGNYLEDAVPGYRTLQVQGRELSPQEIKSITVGDADGDLLQGSRNPSRTITVMYQLICDSNGDFRDKFHKLNSILHGDSHQVVFHDEPDKYWQATMSDVDTVPGGRNSVTSTFTLYIPDGLSHSVDTQTADNMPYKDVPVNLLINTSSSATNGQTSLQGASPSAYGVYSRTDSYEQITSPDPYQYYRFVGTDQNNLYGLTPGETYTLSGSASLTVGTLKFKSEYSTDGKNWSETDLDDLEIPVSDGSVFKPFSHTFTIPVGATGVHFGLQNYDYNDGSLFRFKGMKLEKGGVASPWSPNPADPEYYADTITLTNNGTVPTPLHVTAEMRSDNGFLGLTLDDNQPYQVGNPDEIDGVTYNPSQMLVPAMPALDKYTVNDAKYQVIPPSQGVMKQQGSLQQTSDKHISAKDFGPTPAVKGPRGPAMIYTLPADNEGNKGAKNWTFRVHDGFGSRRNQPRDVGQLCATVLDINGKSIASIIMADLSQTGNEFLLRFDVNQKEMLTRRLTWQDGEGSGFTTHYYIRKSGNQFTFGWKYDTKSYTFACDELADTEAYYVSFSFLKWMDVPTPAYFGLINWNFRKDMVDEFKNLPNYFTNGDLVDLDSKTNTLTINGYPDWDRVDIASEPLLLPPGKSTLGIVYSTFANRPKVTVDFEERWL